MEIDPNQLAQRDRYKLMIGAIVPRPIALVSTLSREGKLNLAPFSFFAGVSSEPMSLLFCPANRPDAGGPPKDTLRNILETATATEPEGVGGPFVVNIVSRPIAEKMAVCAEPLPHGESEFDLSGLTTAPSKRVAPPRVRESLVSFECETMRVIRLAPGVPGGGNIVIGRVVWVHANDGVVNDRLHVDPAALDAVGRMGGLSYCMTRERFDLAMGKG
ncbi:MAG: flavin reductase family protein [Phycisphaerales bacterium]